MNTMTTRATGNAAVAAVVAPAIAFELKCVRIHLSAAGGAGNLTITIDSSAGAAYDTVVLTQDMTAITDLVWQPNRPIECTYPGTHIDIVWANAANRDYGITVNYAML